MKNFLIARIRNGDSVLVFFVYLVILGEKMIVGIVFVLYILMMIAVGVYGYSKTQNLDDYLLGGRKMGAFVSALSAGASDMSGWLLMGLPGAIFAAGLGELWIGVGLLIGTYFNWLVIAKPLRFESERLGAMTVSEYFEKRFPVGKTALRLITAVIILVFFILYTASGLVASGKLFESVFGIDYTTAVVIGTLAIIVYISVGGFIAVCWTDAIQGVLMIGALVIVPLLAVNVIGGWSEMTAAVNSVNSNYLNIWTDSSGQPLTLMSIVSSLGWGLGYMGMPHILVRFMAIESVERIPRARRIAVVWSGVSMLAAITIGIIGIAYFNLENIPPLADKERVFMTMMQTLLSPVPAGICLAAILAAIMSTADSQLLVCTSVITEDIYRSFFRRDATDKELLNIGRFSVVALAAIAMYIAMDGGSEVMGLVSYAWAGFGAAFGPAILLSFYYKRISSIGAIAGIIIGGLVVVVWKNMSGGIFDLYELVPGFFISLLTIIIVSLIVPDKKK